MASSSAAAAACSSSSSLSEEELTLTVKWSGKEYTVRVCGDDSVGELKRRICEVTNVLPKRQKLLYPKLGPKLADDSILLYQLPLKSSLKMTMIGTVEDDIIVDQVDAPEIVDDFELGQDEVVDIKDKEVNKQKLRRRINQFKIELLNPCREGKKLLVLDIDYTLFDHRSTAENPLQLMRPYLHEFLSAVYAEYDIMIWSATSMKWVELKMGQLGVLSNPNYKITALLDHIAMITVQSDSRGIFDCKPLGLIWAQFPEFYNSRNTIMFDDLRRNFVMNPQNGLTIRPFRKAHTNRDSDQELVNLTQYLLAIAELSDLSLLNHKNWESYTEDTAKRRRHN
ncbi:Ubiquitin domain [Macleaya cordata]|uniref:protein-serine/threonine phosphatase n=1 Tax=Macleaya cordata TaxID=56857 RepID=A0A200PTM4_MACCD|nr:Ubiquitin domain [Macleaya cordata]